MVYPSALDVAIYSATLIQMLQFRVSFFVQRVGWNPDYEHYFMKRYNITVNDLQQTHTFKLILQLINFCSIYSPYYTCSRYIIFDQSAKLIFMYQIQLRISPKLIAITEKSQKCNLVN